MLTGIQPKKKILDDIKYHRQTGLSDSEIWERFKAKHSNYQSGKDFGYTDNQMISRLGLEIVFPDPTAVATTTPTQPTAVATTTPTPQPLPTQEEIVKARTEAPAPTSIIGERPPVPTKKPLPEIPFAKIQSAITKISAPLKGVMQTLASTPQVVGSLIQEWAEREPYIDPVSKKPVKLIEDVVTEKQKKKVYDFSQRMIKKNQEYIRSKELLPPEDDEIAKLLYDLGSGATTLGLAVGLSLATKSPHAASVAFGIYQKGGMYQEARNAGVLPSKASALSSIGGGVEGALEYVGLNFLLKKYGGRLMTPIIRAGIEGFQEWSQTTGENVIAKIGWDKTRGICEGSGRSMLLGIILGGGASVVISKIQGEGVLSPLENTEYAPDTEKGQALIENVVKKGMDAGVEELEKVAPDIDKDVSKEEPTPSGMVFDETTQKPAEKIKEKVYTQAEKKEAVKQGLYEITEEGKIRPAPNLIVKTEAEHSKKFKADIETEKKTTIRDLDTKRKLADDWYKKVRRDLTSKSLATRMIARRRIKEAREQTRDLHKRTIKQHAQVMDTQKFSPVERVKENLMLAIRTAEENRVQQDEIRKQELAIAMAEIKKVKVKGERGAWIRMAKLKKVEKDNVVKAEFKSIKNKIAQEDIDILFDEIEESPLLTDWEKIPAKTGLGKLLGEKGGVIPYSSELKVLNRVFGQDFVKTIQDKRPLIKRAKEMGLEIANIPRAIMTSFDLSFGLRQGIMTTARHPKIFFRSFVKQFKWFGSEKASQVVMDEIRGRKNYELALKSGLPLTERYGKLSQREEAFMGGALAEKIPIVGLGIKASNRAYSTFANKLRMDIFDSLLKDAERMGHDPHHNLDLTKKIANFIGNTTGRGSLGTLEKNAVELNTALFSPRLASAHLKTLNMLNPVYYIKQDPFIKQESLKTLIAFASSTATILALSVLAGAKVERDPRNSDFMKIKIGNTRIDLMGGKQQYIVLGMRLLSGKIISSTTGREMKLGDPKKYRPLTRLDILTRAFEMKQSPLFSFATDLLRGQTVIGDEVHIPKEVGKRFIPMVIQDVFDIAKDDPSLLPLSALGVFGVGIQTYRGKPTTYKPIGKTIKKSYTP